MKITVMAKSVEYIIPKLLKLYQSRHLEDLAILEKQISDSEEN